MYHADPMLNGKIMQERHQELVRRLQRESLVRNTKSPNGNDKMRVSVRTILTALINLITR